MKIQRTCTETKQCYKCDKDIYKTEMRLTDKGLHYHFNCKPEPVRKKTFMEWLFEWLGK